jgi:hypothetical protein
MPEFSISRASRNPLYILISALIAAIFFYIFFEDIYISIALVFGGAYWVLTSKSDIEDNVTLPLVDKPIQVIIIGGEFFDYKSNMSLQLMISIPLLIMFFISVVIFLMIPQATSFTTSAPEITPTEKVHAMGKIVLTLMVFWAVYEQVLLFLIKNTRYPKQSLKIIKKNIATYPKKNGKILTGTLYLTEKYIAFFSQPPYMDSNKPTVIPLDSIKNINIVGDSIELDCPDQKYAFSIDNASEFKSEIQKPRSK